MRRLMFVVAATAALLFVGTSTAMAGGPRYGHDFRRGPDRGHWHHHHHHRVHRPVPRVPVCRTPVAVYPRRVYATPVYRALPTYPRLSLGFGGSNFSFLFQQ